MSNISELENIATQIRRDILRMVHAVQSGHPGGSLGCADFFTALFFKVMKHQPSPFEMSGKNEDVFILSNGHISPVYYSALARSGYFEVSELATFRKLNSRLQGHPATHEHLPGIRVASGSLGQGLSVAVGIALAKKTENDANSVFCLCGDGELQEGQIWEALMFAAKQNLGKLIVTVDVNGRQIDGDTKDIMGFDVANLKAKFEAFGFEVWAMNGNHMQETVQTLQNSQNRSWNQKPLAILMETEMGHPIDFMVGSHKWHGVAPNNAQLEMALSQLPLTLGDY